MSQSCKGTLALLDLVGSNAASIMCPIKNNTSFSMLTIICKKRKEKVNYRLGFFYEVFCISVQITVTNVSENSNEMGKGHSFMESLLYNLDLTCPGVMRTYMC